MQRGYILFFTQNKNMNKIGLTIHFWDYINIVKEYSKEVQEACSLVENKSDKKYYNPLCNSGYIIIDIEDETFDLLVNYFKTNKLSKRLKNIILNDIQYHLEEYKKTNEIEKKIEKEKIQKKIKGYIYILKSNGLYKIGRSKNIKNRIKLYKTENPFGIDVIFQKEVDDYINKEIKLLEMFSDKLKLGNEWFDLSDKDIKLIKKII